MIERCQALVLEALDLLDEGGLGGSAAAIKLDEALAALEAPTAGVEILNDKLWPTSPAPASCSGRYAAASPWSVGRR